MDDRYQHQPWYVKTYRWLRWRPWYFIKGCVLVELWLADGAQVVFWPHDDDMPEEYRIKETRWSTLCHIWQCNMSMAQVKMKHYFTTDEVMASLSGAGD